MSAPGAPYALEGQADVPLNSLLPSQLEGLVPDYFTRTNPIIQIVDSQNMTLENITRPGHIFYPGSVLTTVSPSGSGSVIHTVGTGSGRNPAFNNFVGLLYFGFRNSLIATGCAALNGGSNIGSIPY